MSITPWPVGQTFPPGTFTLTMDGGKPLPINFDPAPTFAIKIRRKDGAIPEITGISTILIADAMNSVINVNWAEEDVSLPPGPYEILVLVTYNGGGATGEAISDPEPWELTAT